MKNNANENNKPHIAFFGTPEFAEDILETLIASGYTPNVVVTKPDVPAGRKKILTPSPVKVLAEKHGIPVLTPKKLDETFLDHTRVRSIDLTLVAAYGKILPKSLLDIPRYGSINVHASLLPLYRGASPIQHALLDGRTETGITLMRMEPGLDTGPIIAAKKLAIDLDDTTETLTPRLAALGGKLLARTLPDWLAGNITPEKQNDAHATHCSMIRKEDGLIDWSKPAEKVYNAYRALTPWPGVFSFWNDGQKSVRVKFISMRPSKRSFQNEAPGTILFENKKTIFVLCGNGEAIEVKTLQIEGKSPAPAAAIIAGYPQLHKTKLR